LGQVLQNKFKLQLLLYLFLMQDNQKTGHHIKYHAQTKDLFQSPDIVTGYDGLLFEVSAGSPMNLPTCD